MRDFDPCKFASSFISNHFSLTFWQKRIFLFKFYFPKILKYIFKKIPLLLFMILPLLIFIVLFFPTLVNRYPLFFDTPNSLAHIYLLEGNVKNHKNKELPNVSIAVGGFQTETDEHGKFKLSFLSKEKKDIPIVFSVDENDTIQKVDFNCGNKINKTFYLK